MQVHLRREAPDRARVLGPHRTVGRVAKAVEPVAQGAQPLVEPALHERRGQVGHGGRIRAALGDDALADVAHDVDVDVREPPDEGVRPVEGRQGNLLPRRELQAAVGAEVHHRVGLECVPGPQVGGHVGVRRRLPRAVHEPERVVAGARQGLREDDDVAELDAGDGQRGLIALADRHVLAGGGAVLLDDGVAHARLEVRFHPGRVLGGRHQGRIAGCHVLLERAARVGPHHRPLRLDEGPELVVGLGEPLDRVAGVAQRAQQVEQARRHLQAAGVHGVLAGSLVVVDGHALVAVGLRLQLQPALDEVAEGLEPLGQRVEDLVAVGVGELRRHRVGGHPAVELGQHDAHREHGAGHALLVGHPVVVVLEHRHRRQHGDVALAQPRDGLVGAAEGEPPVRHQHHEVGVDALEEVEALLGGGHRVDVPGAAFEGADERVDVVAVGVEGPGHAGDQGDLRGVRPWRAPRPP